MVNVPFTDTSYKWAGGGFLSTVGDLLKFANIMLYSYQWKEGITVKDGKKIINYVTEKPEHPILDLPPGYLKSDTIKMMWTPVPVTKGTNGLKYRDDGYGMGWEVAPYRAEFGTTGGGDVQNFHARHSGAAVGASSILFILPSDNSSNVPPPKGVCVAIITNMQNVSLSSVAEQIAHIFADIKN
jgi:serine beta-lactamase-like protein LACTB